tara:strand:+ start:30 stop:179 length:150 start_codon:yes stop_codon:yes gene_type:complete
MAKYELSDEQQKQLLAIISAAQVRGSDAPAIVNLAKALQSPLKEEEPKE